MGSENSIKGKDLVDLCEAIFWKDIYWVNGKNKTENSDDHKRLRNSSAAGTPAQRTASFLTLPFKEYKWGSLDCYQLLE